jgi:hypothetical protein
MLRTKKTNKQTICKAKAKAAEGGVSAAQAVFAKVLERADPVSEDVKKTTP